MEIAIPLFDRLTALDAIGHYEVLQRLPDATIRFVGKSCGTLRTENGMLGLVVDHTYSEITEPDVVIVPGGIGSRALLEADPILDWLRDVHQRTRFTTSV
jgi:putative intracellular protease/amidase